MGLAVPPAVSVQLICLSFDLSKPLRTTAANHAQEPRAVLSLPQCRASPSAEPDR